MGSLTSRVDELVEFRAQAQTRLDQIPSLKHDADELFDKAWQQAYRGVRASRLMPTEKWLKSQASVRTG